MRSVRFDPGLDERVRRAAEREGVSVSQFIRDAAAARADQALGEENLLDALGDFVGGVAVGGDARRHKAEFAAAMVEKQGRQESGRRAG